MAQYNHPKVWFPFSIVLCPDMTPLSYLLEKEFGKVSVILKSYYVLAVDQAQDLSLGSTYSSNVSLATVEMSGH